MAMSGSFEEILSKYRSLIKAAVAKYAPLLNGSAEREDMEQTARLAFYRAYKTYDENRSGVTFGLYAKVCVKNACVSMLRKKNKAAKAPVIQLQTPSGQADMPEISMDSLTEKEKKVLVLFADGMSYREISSELGISEKSVDNALFRARSKLKRNLKSK